MTKAIHFQTITWNDVKKEEFKGEKGSAFWQTKKFDDICCFG